MQFIASMVTLLDSLIDNNINYKHVKYDPDHDEITSVLNILLYSNRVRVNNEWKSLMQ